MENKEYRLRYLPSFEQDLMEVTGYITNVLNNPKAALRLVDAVEAAVLERKNNPDIFEPYPSTKKRKHDYYRIYINNYTVFYVVIDDVMEVRRFLYSARNIENIL